MRDKREKAYTEIKEALDISVVDIKTKITSLQAQLGREIYKVRKKKSGQAATDNYESNWVFWEKSQFLIPVMQAGQSRDNLRRDLQTTLSHTSIIPEENNNHLGELDKNLSILPDLQNDGGPPGSCAANKLKKFELELKKQELLLSTCITVLKEPVPSIAPEPDIISKRPFAIHVAAWEAFAI